MSADEKTVIEETPQLVGELTGDDERDIERFVENSQGYCQKIYRKAFDDNELEELRKEIKERNEAIKKIKSDWGVA